MLAAMGPIKDWPSERLYVGSYADSALHPSNIGENCLGCISLLAGLESLSFFSFFFLDHVLASD